MKHLARGLLAVTLALAPVTASAQPPAPPSSTTGDVWSRLFSLDPSLRTGAVAELPAVGTPLAHAWIDYVARVDPDPRVRAAAAEALARTGLPEHARTAAWMAENDPDPFVRAVAAQSAERTWPLTRSPGKAIGWALLPGGGQYYLRQPLAGSAVLATTVGLIAGGIALTNAHPKGGELGEPLDPALDPKDPIAFQLLMAGQNVWFTSIFSAYRDARRLRGNVGYRTPLNEESIGTLVSAPVRPSVLASPWVWGGLPVMVGLAVGLGAVVDGGFRHDGRPSIFRGDPVNFLGHRYSPGTGFALGEAYFAGLYLPVGLGEEALFRGVLLPSLTESWGPWGGWAISSAIFGGVHVFNFVGEGGGLEQAAIAVPFITVVGSYLGFVSMKSGYTLSRSIALHAWYDFLLSTADFLADPQHQPFVARFGGVF